MGKIRIVASILVVMGALFLLGGLMAVPVGAGGRSVPPLQPSPRPPWNATMTPTPGPGPTSAPPPPPPTPTPTPLPILLPVSGGGAAAGWFLALGGLCLLGGLALAASASPVGSRGR